jgi:hypothetical protein
MTTKTTNATTTVEALAVILTEIRNIALAEIAKPERFSGSHDQLKQKASDAFNKLEQLRYALAAIGIYSLRAEGA